MNVDKNTNMTQVEYDLLVSLLFLKQSIENLERHWRPEVPLEVEKPRPYRPHIPSMMKLHSRVVTVTRLK